MKIILAILTSLFLVSCAHKGMHKKVQTHENWGNLSKVTSVHSHVYTSAQPDKKALEKFKAEGGALVINLRTKAEPGYDKDEKSKVESLGMKYYHVPVKGKALSAKSFDKVEEIIQANKGQKVLLHCSSGNRAGAWFAYHVYTNHKDKKEKAMRMGEAMGMKKQFLKDQVEAMMK